MKIISFTVQRLIHFIFPPEEDAMYHDSRYKKE